MAQRYSFGDRKLPDISRKITACVACRKLKIKCYMPEQTKPPCTRCKARGIPCTVNKSLQMLLENDASWKEAIEHRMAEVETALQHRSTPTPILATSRYDDLGLQSQIFWDASITNLAPSKSTEPVPEAPYRVTLNLSCSLGGFPASSIAGLTLTERGDHYGGRPDLISCATISMETGEGLFAFYKLNLDSLIHYVLPENDTLASVRSRSSILTAAICTVASLCLHSNAYQNCLDVFKKEVASKMFCDHYTFDDVRALCIGGFWLKNISTALNGLAVRIATELDLHRCITKMPHAKRSCYDRTRLYFLVYLCDHHCSLIYGRPPMTREWRTLKSPGAFLQSNFSTRKDLRLISQVELWSINRNVFEQFGADIEDCTASSWSADLNRLSEAYDCWQQNWHDALVLKDEDEPCHQFMSEFYLFSAKLYLFSHAFRGPSQIDYSAISGLLGGTKPGQSAFFSALSIVYCVINTTDARKWLHKLPCYFLTMLAFASICLLRLSREGQSVQEIDRVKALDYMQQLAKVLITSALAENASEEFSSIARSIEKALYDQHNPSQYYGTPDGDVIDDSFNFALFANDATNFDFFGNTA